jgi:hypothetical protein
MPEIKRISRTDTYLQLFFGDGSVRALDIAQYLPPDQAIYLDNEPVLSPVSIHPDFLAITWDDGTELTAEFLYEHSQLIGWIDKSWGDRSQAWQPLKIEIAEIKTEFIKNELLSTLLLDGMPFPALRFSSVTFGIHKNTAWYHIPFPGDNGVYEPEWEEPQIVFDTLDQMVLMANHVMSESLNATLDLTGLIMKTGMDIYAAPLSPRSAAIFARHFLKHST